MVILSLVPVARATRSNGDVSLVPVARATRSNGDVFEQTSRVFLVLRQSIVDGDFVVSTGSPSYQE